MYRVSNKFIDGCVRKKGVAIVFVVIVGNQRGVLGQAEDAGVGMIHEDGGSEEDDGPHLGVVLGEGREEHHGLGAAHGVADEVKVVGAGLGEDFVDLGLVVVATGLVPIKVPELLASEAVVETNVLLGVRVAAGVAHPDVVA